MQHLNSDDSLIVAIPKAVGHIVTTSSPSVTADFNVLGAMSVVRNAVGDYTLSWSSTLNNVRGFFSAVRTAGNGFASLKGVPTETSLSLRIVNGDLDNEDIGGGVDFVIYGNF